MKLFAPRLYEAHPVTVHDLRFMQVSVLLHAVGFAYGARMYYGRPWVVHPWDRIDFGSDARV
jgi:hypothetical protein